MIVPVRLLEKNLTPRCISPIFFYLVNKPNMVILFKDSPSNFINFFCTSLIKCLFS